MRINDLLNKKILIWGYGLEGRSASDLLLRRGIGKEIIVASGTALGEKIDGVRFIGEKQILAESFDVLIKSPGVSSYRDEMGILKNRGVVLTSTLNILLAEAYGRKNPKIIGITGTKGKSTTTAICQNMLRFLGLSATMLGNIGIPFLGAVDSLDSYDYLILELSSCQLKNIMYRMDYGILLNLFPEHIDWHRSHENYFRDKLRIVEYSDKCFVNGDDPITSGYVDKSKHKYFFNDKASFHLEKNFLCYAKDKLIDVNSFGNIQGLHIFKNICALLAVFREDGLDVVRALEGLGDFRTLPHRLEIFYNDSELGTKFVDDSISTIPEATIEAIKTFGEENIFLILGGFDRQQDCSKITDFLKGANNVRKVFLIGQTGKKMANIPGFSEYFDNFEDLVRAVGSHDLRSTTVLLSPGAASYDMFKNFEERGNVFKKLMLSL
ncbi:MAG: UDP-N-acetylmuramoyl-L-alanine--D-glutamate ligase [Rickettsiales bacterium]|jgi:UDP-N-acetylmuramoylalanine--D-glutamate ligase|nr:UDP-N-acetylmuramoyl-L-alanine--D-glutamate ligase [Rickettsiales bacterium]